MRDVIEITRAQKKEMTFNPFISPCSEILTKIPVTTNETTKYFWIAKR